jgi:hypothetical protein
MPGRDREHVASRPHNHPSLINARAVINETKDNDCFANQRIEHLLECRRGDFNRARALSIGFAGQETVL